MATARFTWFCSLAGPWCRRVMVGVALVVLAAPGARADDDLDLIPDFILDEAPPEEPPPAPEKSTNWEHFLSVEAQYQRAWARRDLITPRPATGGLFSETPLNAGLTFFAWRGNRRISPRTTLHLDDRLSVVAAESRQDGLDLQNDLREVYVSHHLGGGHYLDLGRINIREGVGTGFNPTDYFKVGALRVSSSGDPLQARQQRLGTLMARWQFVGKRGSLSAAFAPAVPSSADRWWTDGGSFSLALHKTNARERFHLKWSPLWFETDNPEFLLYRDNERWRAGANWAKGVGERWVLYGELSAEKVGGPAEGVADLVPGPYHRDVKPRLKGTFGFNYTDGHLRSYWLEYELNQSGIVGDDWDRWFTDGATATALAVNPATNAQADALIRQLWNLRGAPTELSEPLDRHVLFGRFHWENAFIQGLDLSVFNLTNLHDRSNFTHPRVDYALDENRVVSVFGLFFEGQRRSEFASLPVRSNVRIGFTKFF